jgi:hypothetical protein
MKLYGGKMIMKVNDVVEVEFTARGNRFTRVGKVKSKGPGWVELSLFGKAFTVGTFFDYMEPTYTVLE